jgi:hypothetical protein
MPSPRQIYLIPIDGSGKSKKLTSGTQGATHGPVLNNKGNEIAWLELDEDGYEADRYEISLIMPAREGHHTNFQGQDCHLRFGC